MLSLLPPFAQNGSATGSVTHTADSMPQRNFAVYKHTTEHMHATGREAPTSRAAFERQTGSAQLQGLVHYVLHGIVLR